MLINTNSSNLQYFLTFRQVRSQREETIKTKLCPIADRDDIEGSETTSYKNIGNHYYSKREGAFKKSSNVFSRTCDSITISYIDGLRLVIKISKIRRKVYPNQEFSKNTSAKGVKQKNEKRSWSQKHAKTI